MNGYECPSNGCTCGGDTPRELRIHLYNAHGLGKLEADDLIEMVENDE